MITKITNGISVKLDQEFANSIIYTEEVEQGFKEPCFFIKLINPESSHVLGNRYKRVNSFDIHYFPSENGGNDELLVVAEKMIDALEYIYIADGLIRGTDMNYKIVKGVLHFFINYDMFVLKPTIPEEYMEKLNVVMEVEDSDN